MPRKKQTRGACVFCGREMTRGGLNRHLASCAKRKKANAAAPDGASQTLYHLVARAAYTPDFWLHLEVNGRAALRDLDSYLRAIWLECCGHMSQFSIGGWAGREIPMSRAIESVFSRNVELTHIYDFGSSTHTLIKPAGTRQGRPLTGSPVYLMARNNMPDAECDECGEPAGWYCEDCFVETGEWIALCQKHLIEHGHDEYGGPTPLVNSPRLGVCGYRGPAEPPY